MVRGHELIETTLLLCRMQHRYDNHDTQFDMPNVGLPLVDHLVSCIAGLLLSVSQLLEPIRMFD